MASIYKNGRNDMLKKPPIEADASHLPCDILENILSRLPVKSLVRFKSVSKSWNSIISDPEFAKVHLHQSKNSDSQALFIWKPSDTSKKFCLLEFRNQTFQIEEVLEFPLKKFHRAKVLCSCDGLVLLKNDHRGDMMYVLWNPSSRTYTTFSYPIDLFCRRVTHGLCYDSTNDDYKVVIVTHNFYAVFSYKNNSWMQSEELLFVAAMWKDPGLFVHEVLHWVVTERCKAYDDLNAQEGRHLEYLEHLELLNKHCDQCDFLHCDCVNYPIFKRDYYNTHEILSFDPRDNKFNKFPKPESLEDTDVFSLTNLRGHLCLFRNTYDKTKVEIWMMKEYGICNSWMKLLAIENLPVPHGCYLVTPICWTNQNEILLDISSSAFLIYSPETNKFGEIQEYYAEENPPDPYEWAYLNPLTCLDSFFLPTRSQRPKNI